MGSSTRQEGRGFEGQEGDAHWKRVLTGMSEAGLKKDSGCREGIIRGFLCYHDTNLSFFVAYSLFGVPDISTEGRWSNSSLLTFRRGIVEFAFLI